MPTLSLGEGGGHVTSKPLLFKCCFSFGFVDYRDRILIHRFGTVTRKTPRQHHASAPSVPTVDTRYPDLGNKRAVLCIPILCSGNHGVYPDTQAEAGDGVYPNTPLADNGVPGIRALGCAPGPHACSDRPNKTCPRILSCPTGGR